MQDHHATPAGPRPRQPCASRMGFGGDWNPEQWDREVWAEDIELMQACGVNLVTLGVFSWAMVEPRPGEYDFAWLDEAMERLHAAGIAVDLSTMTASPPPWFSSLHPEALPVREDGTRLWHGSRRHYCPSSPAYRDRAHRLVEVLARRYADHPALALWHVDNEYTGGVPECFCDASVQHFRRFLASRYGSVQDLNTAWSTTFWSQRYGSFDEVRPPRPVPAAPNPAACIDFARFMSSAYEECFREQVAILRRITPDVSVTTNLLMTPRAMDLHRWADGWDVSSIDVYADPLAPDRHEHAAFSYDLCRSLRRDASWMLMEQAPSAVNWQQRCGPKPPGLMRSQSLQAVAHGADAVLFFQWRQSLGGAEKFHSAMVPNAGTSSRTHREVRELGHELAGLADVVGSRVVADAALLMDWENWWAVELPNHPRADVDHLAELHRWHAAAYRLGVVTDIVHPAADLSRYPLVLAPNLYLASDAVLTGLADYVRGGGTLVVGAFSGVVDECDRLRPGGWNAGTASLVGGTVEEYWPLPVGGRVRVTLGDDVLQAVDWTEELTPDGADVVASFAEGALAGRAAVTRNRHGDGHAWYLGATFDEEGLQRLLERALVESGATASGDGLPAGVSLVRRRSATTEYVFVMNHREEEVSVTQGDTRHHLGPLGVLLTRRGLPPLQD